MINTVVGSPEDRAWLRRSLRRAFNAILGSSNDHPVTDDIKRLPLDATIICREALRILGNLQHMGVEPGHGPQYHVEAVIKKQWLDWELDDFSARVIFPAMTTLAGHLPIGVAMSEEYLEAPRGLIGVWRDKWHGCAMRVCIAKHRLFPPDDATEEELAYYVEDPDALVIRFDVRTK